MMEDYRRTRGETVYNEVIYTRRCKICGKEFKTPYSMATYCGDECRIAGRRAVMKAHIEKYKDVVKKCPVCGRDFHPVKSSYKDYCSRRCRDIHKGKRGRLGVNQRLNKSVPMLDIEKATEDGSPGWIVFVVDEYGFRTPFKPRGSRIPLVDDGKLDYYWLLDYHYQQEKSIREICEMPKRKRAEFTSEWTYSEYMLARSWMARKEIRGEG